MKKIINDPTTVVDEMLQGLTFIHSDVLRRAEGFDVIMRRAEKQGHVGIISGGGSGHEPAHAGFVGEGMLSGAVCVVPCLRLLRPTKFWKQFARQMRVLAYLWLSKTTPAIS